ncbi:Protein of unknown function [Gryllus bimaculatus]|nr:Protein of unknown function [Gryllus bimaculatus]
MSLVSAFSDAVMSGRAFMSCQSIGCPACAALRMSLRLSGVAVIVIIVILPPRPAADEVGLLRDEASSLQGTMLCHLEAI